MKEKHTYHHADAAEQLPQALRANPYTVPNGYFESLYHHTIQRCQQGDMQATFGVPAGYFEQLTESITAKIAEEKLKAVVNDPGFAVPEGYFGESEQLLMAHHKINGHVADAGFTAPEHYFDRLSDQIKQRAQQPSIPARRLGRPKWVAYAAAASVAVVLGWVGMFSIAPGTSETKSPLAAVSDQQILDYLELYGAPNDMMYISEQFDDFDERTIGEGISEEDIEAYLNHTL
ncbi:hypothetical protein [Parapedobacter sp. 2B3]|uniref:hypothetical protein n=1 Tax=Parapedobacter sp. 2B3 TaxID=3342381 RepID=UPI0035B5AF30